MLTPYTRIDRDLLQQNILRFAAIAQHHGLTLRPHVKTHKSPDIARLQVEAGACGITVATMLEAQAFALAGFRDIFVACPQASADALHLLRDLLSQGVRVIVGFDHPEHLPLLHQVAEASAKPLELRLEIDSGHHRCGVSDLEQVVSLGKAVQNYPGLRLEGVYTHAGHVYAAKSVEQIRQIAHDEGTALLRASAALAKEAIPVASLSAGSTPTHRYVAQVPGLTELRPGNYVFFDAMQVGLGVAQPEQCALQVVATVLSVYPGRFVIDAGSKALALDKGAHGLDGLRGHGLVLGEPGWLIARLSEEHGIVELEDGARCPRVGERVQIVPNHACVVANLGKSLQVTSKDDTQQWTLIARR